MPGVFTRLKSRDWGLSLKIINNKYSWVNEVLGILGARAAGRGGPHGTSARWVGGY